MFFQRLDFILQGLDRPFKSPWVLAHRLFSKGEVLSVLSGGPCCSAASAAEMARQTATATPAATGPGLLAARGHGLWWTGGEDSVKSLSGKMDAKRMRNACTWYWCKMPQHYANFGQQGRRWGMLLLRSIYFDFLNRLHWNKRCRIGQGSCELHEENALPTINLIQKSFNIFRRVISPMFPMHDFTLPKATGRTSHLFRCRRMRRAGGFASCMWKRHGAVAKARPATWGSRRCSRRRRRRALRRRKNEEEKHRLETERSKEKKRREGTREKTRDWCRSNIPNGESCTYLTHNYFTLNHELKQIGKSIPQGLAASHQAATQLEAVQRLKGGKISINFPTLWSWFGFETRCKCDRASQQLAAKSEVLVTSFPICFNLIMTNPTCLFSGMYHI